ncbi:MAG: site-specific DNA recombinase [Clostridium sp.]|jgi:site-specific DNA recombinase
MKIAIYSRKSKFTGKGESMDNQVHLCKEYISSHFNNFEILLYEDEGFSGGNIDRPQYKILLNDIKKKNIDALVCYRLDRISRNVADFSNVLETLEKNNIIFVSIREQFDTSTPMGKAMIYIASVFAQLERETIAERIRDNMMELAKTGRWLGGKTPTGFKSKKITSVASGKERSLYVLDPVLEEQELVKLIYEKYLEFESLNRVESFLLNSFTKTKYGNKYDMSTIRKLISNPVYCIGDELLYDYCVSNNMVVVNDKSEFDGTKAVISYNKNDGKTKKAKEMDKWIIALGEHEGFIPSSNWVQVQNILLRNFDRSPRTNTGRVALLSTLLKCSNCGSRMRITGKYSNGELKHYYYKCRLKNDSKGQQCSMANLNGKDAEKFVFESLKNAALNEEASKLKYKKRDKLDTKNIVKEKDNIIKEISKKEIQINKLTTSLMENENSSANKYIIKQIEILDGNIKPLKIRLSELEQIKESSLINKMNYDLYSQNLKMFINNVEDLDFDEKKKLLNGVIKEITWNGKQLLIELLG